MDLTREHLHPKLRDYAIDGICARSLERVLERCRQRGLEVLLVGVPAPGPCREGYSPAIEKVYRAYLAGLRSRLRLCVHRPAGVRAGRRLRRRHPPDV